MIRLNKKTRFKETHVPGYFVIESGEVFTMKRGYFRAISQSPDASGYLRVEFRVDGERKKFFVHKLVADAFLAPPRGKKRSYIEHKNKKRQDNRANNLRRRYWGKK